eukprot:CAMPEP_0197352242 /NCGR_PEP_ID=MMETSP0893-20130614/35079_1 /TAXON_ID=44058 ORGANISM="Aureoumbra lagunensis, Strain CCMP1510" /NCGR_SAMPLE_ID=MMETSP0893 /ASSEMBLY_ACC=CAM_ASM_000539 /LENGTH=69 /DNA_ID=CAMNT_0042866525 /DNA_START=79 /DNA_END=288 /DNA_ORIENTATION=-
MAKIHNMMFTVADLKTFFSYSSNLVVRAIPKNVRIKIALNSNMIWNNITGFLKINGMINRNNICTSFSK